jgi:hypothetical protein
MNQSHQESRRTVPFAENPAIASKFWLRDLLFISAMNAYRPVNTLSIKPCHSENDTDRPCMREDTARKSNAAEAGQARGSLVIQSCRRIERLRPSHCQTRVIVKLQPETVFIVQKACNSGVINPRSVPGSGIGLQYIAQCGADHAGMCDNKHMFTRMFL